MVIAEIAAAAGSISAAIDIARGLRDTADRFGDAETKLAMAELISKLADAKLEAAAGAARIEELERQLALTESMTFEQGMYWQVDGDKRDGPFCQRCFDADGKALRLQPGEHEYAYPWECRECKSEYGERKPRPNSRRQLSMPSRRHR